MKNESGVYSDDPRPANKYCGINSPLIGRLYDSVGAQHAAPAATNPSPNTLLAPSASIARGFLPRAS
jgi:hypothetical protein